MKKIFCFVILNIFINLAHTFAQEIPHILSNRYQKIENLTQIQNIKNILIHSKFNKNLNCQLVAKVQSLDQNFSSESQKSHQLQIYFSTRYLYNPSLIFYINSKSEFYTEIKNSSFGGLIEEIQINTNDEYDTTLVLQHDGQGIIHWIYVYNTLMHLPCNLEIEH